MAGKYLIDRAMNTAERGKNEKQMKDLVKMQTGFVLIVVIPLTHDKP